MGPAENQHRSYCEGGVLVVLGDTTGGHGLRFPLGVAGDPLFALGSVELPGVLFVAPGVPGKAPQGDPVGEGPPLRPEAGGVIVEGCVLLPGVGVVGVVVPGTVGFGLVGVVVCGVAVPAGGVAVVAGGVAVVAGGVAVPAGGVAGVV